MTNLDYWGKHLICNCSNCNINITKKEIIKEFILKLCCITYMTPIGDVIFYEVEKTKENDEADLTGLTAFQMIKTSNITIHFCEPSKSLYLDFFSCKTYNEEDVIDLIKVYFRPERTNSKIVLRDANKDLN